MNTIRLATRFMVGNPGDYKYILHINCPCTLKANYVGTYDTVEQAEKIDPQFFLDMKSLKDDDEA